MSQASTLPWIEKYRPKELSDLISHGEIISTITRLIDEGRMPHLLLYGPAGTGKTSTILACARRLYGAQFSSMVLELNASDARGIDVVRQQIKDFASTRQIFSKGFKLVILDEADSMTHPAQFALRRVIEKYTQNARFCIICNYVSKVIPALQSRCTKFRFGPLDEESIEARLRTIAQTEQVNYTDTGLKSIIQLSNGDMRRCLNIMQAVHMADSLVDENNVYHSTGAPHPSDVDQILNWMFNEDFQQAFQLSYELKNHKGLAMQDLIGSFHARLVWSDFPPNVKCDLLESLANISHQVSFGLSEKIQFAALVGIFQQARKGVMEAAEQARQDPPAQ
eukprot:gnl/Trimastix_PCT/3629.p1 GENE.gnl/Trimastix_PCT/3629~~gnl/Trimastix_PCT/3629.p1  ORF type:complete len:337 (+),score=84.04 gnl/Trimastix_PCT/3629:36-1046(+)